MANYYPKTPIEAMQCKLAALASIPYMRRTGTFLGETPLHLRLFDYAMQRSEIYQWSQFTAQQVLDASQTYPLSLGANYVSHVQAGEEDQPHPHPILVYAFFTFDGPVLPPLPGYEEEGPVSALLAVPCRFPDGTRHYRFFGLGWDGGAYTTPYFNNMWPWPDDMERHEAQFHHGEMLMRFLMTASQFVEQKIMVEGSAQLCRTGRKLAARAHVSPAIRTIHLRAREQTTHHAGGSHVEYTCRWIVRGHWRKQFYPKLSDHRPVFIEPYVKGPDNQPLKTPAPDVFVVNR